MTDSEQVGTTGESAPSPMMRAVELLDAMPEGVFDRFAHGFLAIAYQPIRETSFIDLTSFVDGFIGLEQAESEIAVNLIFLLGMSEGGATRASSSARVAILQRLVGTRIDQVVRAWRTSPHDWDRLGVFSYRAGSAEGSSGLLVRLYLEKLNGELVTIEMAPDGYVRLLRLLVERLTNFESDHLKTVSRDDWEALRSVVERSPISIADVPLDSQ